MKRSIIITFSVASILFGVSAVYAKNKRVPTQVTVDFDKGLIASYPNMTPISEANMSAYRAVVVEKLEQKPASFKCDQFVNDVPNTIGRIVNLIHESTYAWASNNGQNPIIIFQYIDALDRSFIIKIISSNNNHDIVEVQGEESLKQVKTNGNLANPTFVTASDKRTYRCK